MNTMNSVQSVIEELNQLNARDPNQLEVEGSLRPRQLVEALRLADWVARLRPEPTPALAIAPHCQHLMRWTMPRSEYPDGRLGYLKWRKDLAKMHAAKAAEVMRKHHLDETIIAQVRAINLKESLKANPDAQTMEDALCLTFLQYDLEDFSAKHPEEKVVDILQKTWSKMSEPAREMALSLPLSQRASQLITKALK